MVAASNPYVKLGRPSLQFWYFKWLVQRRIRRVQDFSQRNNTKILQALKHRHFDISNFGVWVYVHGWRHQQEVKAPKNGCAWAK